MSKLTMMVSAQGILSLPCPESSDGAISFEFEVPCPAAGDKVFASFQYTFPAIGDPVSATVRVTTAASYGWSPPFTETEGIYLAQSGGGWCQNAPETPLDATYIGLYNNEECPPYVSRTLCASHLNTAPGGYLSTIGITVWNRGSCNGSIRIAARTETTETQTQYGFPKCAAPLLVMNECIPRPPPPTPAPAQLLILPPSPQPSPEIPSSTPSVAPSEKPTLEPTMAPSPAPTPTPGPGQCSVVNSKDVIMYHPIEVPCPAIGERLVATFSFDLTPDTTQVVIYTTATTIADSGSSSLQVAQIRGSSCAYLPQTIQDAEYMGELHNPRCPVAAVDDVTARQWVTAPTNAAVWCAVSTLDRPVSAGSFYGTRSGVAIWNTDGSCQGPIRIAARVASIRAGDGAPVCMLPLQMTSECDGFGAGITLATAAPSATKPFEDGALGSSAADHITGVYPITSWWSLSAVLLPFILLL